MRADKCATLVMQYIPILRLGPVELDLLENYQQEDRLLPLIEVTKRDHAAALTRVKAACGLGNYLVSLPQYLTAYATRHKQEVGRILENFQSEQPLLDFFSSIRSHGGTPVVAPKSLRQQPIDYSELVAIAPLTRSISDRLAFHVPVFPRELTNTQRQQLHSLRALIEEGDILLLDLVRVKPAAAVFKALKAVLSILGQLDGCLRFVLGGMDVNWSETAIHNYGPLFVKELSLDGFGDYITNPRYEPSGGPPRRERPVKRYVVYYSSLSHDLRRFGDYQYSESVRQLQGHQFWTQAIITRHMDRCNVCAELARGNMTNDAREWKFFRMSHYANSILDETLPAIQAVQNSYQLDRRGYRNALIRHA
ncbi:hypothetical protein KAX17_07185 [Candidatus Bipolaricaulota bacterium]|nr:hypothetical protein [Candidatus Bipolaricaulota bacterium]